MLQLSWQMALDQQDRKNSDDRIQNHKSQKMSILAMHRAWTTFGLPTATLGGDEGGWRLLPFGHCAHDRYVWLEDNLSTVLFIF